MIKTSMALAELAEKGPDFDMLRKMLGFATQRLMEFDVKNRCGAPYGERADGTGLADQLREKYPKLSAMLDDAESEVRAHMQFPKAHRAQIASTNPWND